MSNEQAQVQVSNARVAEIFKGKVAASIGELMEENARLQAVVEALSTELQDARQQVTAYKQRDLSQRATPSAGETADPHSPPPQ